METVPFASFFEALQKKGFSVTPAQVINAHKIIRQYADKVRSDKDLCLYLAPVFAGTEEQQRLFAEVFHAEFKTDRSFFGKRNFKESIEQAVKKNQLKLLIGYSILAIAVVFLIIFSFNINTITGPSSVTVSVHTKANPLVKLNDGEPIRLTINEKVELETQLDSLSKDVSKYELLTKYSWGDKNDGDSGATHIYIRPGQYYLNVYFTVLYNKKVFGKGEYRYPVDVCYPGEVAIRMSANTNQIKPGNKVLFTALMDGREPIDSMLVEWIKNKDVLGYDNKMSVVFDSAGYYNITCNIYNYRLPGSCTFSKTISLKVGTVNSPAANKTPEEAQQEEILPPKKNFTRVLYYLYAALAIVFCALAVFFFITYEKSVIKRKDWRSKEKNKDLLLNSSPPGKDVLVELPFKDNHYLIVDQHEISGLAKSLRRRINDNVLFLDINKTINRSINAGGLYQAVNISRTRPPEYLVLIDERNNNRNMVKLFEYLLGILKKQNIAIEIFYFKQTPGICYNANEPNGVSLDKLSGKYSKHVLLIFWDAATSFTSLNQSEDKEQTDIIRHWQYKAIITQVPFPDWELTNQQQHFNIFPVDMEGLIIMTELLLAAESDSHVLSRLAEKRKSFYKTSGIDFDDINAVVQYCNNVSWAKREEDGKIFNIFFEWVAALAVYPKIHWEIVLAVGKAVLDRYHMSQELNFTNILRILRISWVKQGIFPGDIRLQLFTMLSVESELVAREAILLLLNQMPLKEEENKIVYDQREMQKLVNEFNLYVHDPLVYARYSESKAKFESLWKQDLINDRPFKLYLENKDKGWQTMMRHESLPLNISADEYFEVIEKEESGLTNTWFWLTIISVFVFVSSCFGLLILYRWEAAGI